MTTEQAEAARVLDEKIAELKLPLMDEVSFQANRKRLAKELGCEVPFLKARYQAERARRAAELNGAAAPREQIDPWAAVPFTLLGVRGENAFFFDHVTKQIVWGPPTKQRLLQLADDKFYFRIAPGKRGINWDGAISQVSARARAAGIFDIGRIRHRGAWLDRIDGTDKLVLNIGDQLLVDGKLLPLGWGPSGKHIYAAELCPLL
jgi:hypothetical protein